MLHHRLRDERRRAHAFERGDAAGALLRAVHAARVELHDAVGVRQAAVADAVVLRIELDDVDAGDQRVEDVRALRRSSRRPSRRRSASPPFLKVAVGGGDDDRLDAAARGTPRAPAPKARAGAVGEPGGGARDEEITTVELVSHGRCPPPGWPEAGQELAPSIARPVM